MTTRPDPEQSVDLIARCECGHGRWQHSDPEVRDDGDPGEPCGVKGCIECEGFTPERMRILPRGTKVRVPKGTPVVYDTAPGERRACVGRTQTVEVHWMTHHPDTIYWAGAGGYWKGVRLTDETEVL